MNRVLCFLGERDPQQQAAVLRKRAAAVVTLLETTSGDVVEFWLPSSTDLADEGQSEGTLSLTACLNLKIEPVPVFKGSALFLAGQLQEAAERLEQAASRLVSLAEGGPA